MTRAEAVVEAAQREAREGIRYVIAYHWTSGAGDPPSEGYYVEPVTSLWPSADPRGIRH